LTGRWFPVFIFISVYADIYIGRNVEDIAQIYKALSEPMRLRIMMLLMKGELCVCDFMEVLEEPQSKVSRHLAYLKHSGLIQGKRVGTWMHYFLRDHLDGLIAAHIKLLKKELPGRNWAKADAAKLIEVQKKKLCDNAAGNGPAARRKAVAGKGRIVLQGKKRTNP